MAGDPIYVPTLIGLGLTELSLSSHSIPFIKRLIRSLRMKDIEEITNEAMSLNSSGEIMELMLSTTRKFIPGYFPN